jgi:hypothetical protein
MSSFSDKMAHLSLSGILQQINGLTATQKRYYLAFLVSLLGSSCLLKTFWHVFVVPKELRHIPRVHTLLWFWSIVRGDSHDVRTKKLMMPLMNQYGLCLKYILGRWTLTVGDPTLLQALLKDIETYPKEQVTMDPVSLYQVVYKSEG